MNVRVKRTSANEAYIIKNMYPLYLHDLSEHYQTYPNLHGIYEESGTIQTLEEQYGVQNIWWEKPDTLFPYLILPTTDLQDLC